MNGHLPGGWLYAITAAVILTAAGVKADDGTSPTAAPAVDAASNGWRLLFSGPSDIVDTWGSLTFGVTPIRQVRECAHPGFAVAGCFARADGNWEVYGQQLTEIERGEEPYARVAVWRLVRAITRDGIALTDEQTLFESQPAAWTDHIALAYNPDVGEYLLLKLKVDRSGFAYTAFFSRDGTQWQPHDGNPLFYDGDAMSLFWSPVLRRFVCVNKSLQPYRKRVVDHGGPTPRLNDDGLRDRRVLMMRSSADGRSWEPSVSLSDVWDRLERKDSIPAAFLTVPDRLDPPDLEFYSGNAFWYHDRAYMMVLNYAPSPLLPRRHGPHLDNEWWTSRDGWRWERPARGVNALEVFPSIPRLENSPLVADGMILFPRGQRLLGVPQDRISYVTARAHGEFSSARFRMPDADLLLNAAVPSPERPFAGEQAYVMVAVLDEQDQVIAGYEADKCLIRNVDQPDIPLRWDTVSARPLAGRTVRLKFLLRSANIYAVTTRSEP